MEALIIIPARYASQRFPGKLLEDLGGKSVLARTMERCVEAKRVARLVVATDDPRIAQEAEAEKGEAILTSEEHRSGTDRCAEALEKVKGDEKVLINVQGDEPFILPEQIDRLVELFEDPHVEIGTLVRRIEKQEEVQDPNRVKAVFSPEGEALYFSRSPIPYQREKRIPLGYQHIGMYGFRTETLPELADLSQSPLEEQEGLEQLRWIENGYRIRIAISKAHQPGIDSPEDLERARKELSKSSKKDGLQGGGSA